MWKCFFGNQSWVYQFLTDMHSFLTGPQFYSHAAGWGGFSRSVCAIAGAWKCQEAIWGLPCPDFSSDRSNSALPLSRDTILEGASSSPFGGIHQCLHCHESLSMCMALLPVKSNRSFSCLPGELLDLSNWTNTWLDGCCRVLQHF